MSPSSQFVFTKLQINIRTSLWLCLSIFFF